MKLPWRKRSSVLWVVSLYLAERELPIVWVTDLEPTAIALHLPSIGTDFGGSMVVAFDIVPT